MDFQNWVFKRKIFIKWSSIILALIGSILAFTVFGKYYNFRSNTTELKLKLIDDKHDPIQNASVIHIDLINSTKSSDSIHKSISRKIQEYESDENGNVEVKIPNYVITERNKGIDLWIKTNDDSELKKYRLVNFNSTGKNFLESTIKLSKE